jgi:hypothetical protein
MSRSKSSTIRALIYLSASVLSLISVLPAQLSAYPLDGYEETNIGRLEAASRIQNDLLKGSKQPGGALLQREQVDLRLVEHDQIVLPPPDKKFSQQIKSLLGGNASRYGISVLDLSDLNNIRYAEHNGNQIQNPGSVGKLLVALGIFQALAEIYPNDIDARWRILKETNIVADEFIISDSHTVRMWDRENEKLIRRPLKIGDNGTMLEYLDWMISPSSNAAAATLTKHAMLLKAFGPQYPVSIEVADSYFKETDRKSLTATLAAAIEEPVERNGLDLKQMRQGSFFTHTGKRKVQGTNSYATPRQLMEFVLLMEQGKLVDEFSSRELKRLMYVTERRIRYASAPTLRESAVYFKSGSLYKCQPEPDFECKKYHGNVRNFMNSVAIVESPAADRDLFYVVTLMSNVLRRNSAVDHQTFATRTHRLIKSFHAARLKREAEQVSKPPMPTITDEDGHQVYQYQ